MTRKRLTTAVWTTTVILTVAVFIVGHVQRPETIELIAGTLSRPLLIFWFYILIPYVSGALALARWRTPAQRYHTRLLLGVAAVVPWWFFLAIMPGRNGADEFENDARKVLLRQQWEAFNSGVGGVLATILVPLFLVALAYPEGRRKTLRHWTAAVLVPVSAIGIVWIGYLNVVPTSAERYLERLGYGLHEALPEAPNSRYGNYPRAEPCEGRLLWRKPRGCKGVVSASVLERDDDFPHYRIYLFT